MFPTYDSELLRSFVAIADAGSFAKAAARLNITQSTISQQMKRLEEQVNQPLFAASGRCRVLTESGELLLSYARKILALNESAHIAMQHGVLGGAVRVGVVQDFADTRFPHALRTFARRHPSVRVEARVASSRDLSSLLDEGLLDLAIIFDEPKTRPGAVIRRVDLVWLAARDFVPPAAGEPWPLILFEGACTFRDRAIEALDERHMPWRVVYTCPGLSGLHAAARAGLGVCVRIEDDSEGLRVLDKREGLPTLGSTCLKLITATETLPAVAEELAASLRAACASSGGRLRPMGTWLDF
ncbi:LysR substrate-binding domain-containing protein [Pendulispora rubella]|uniref:LysR substrate-binding domain-containing protein n=1 Tax=Pendulispora rubella TaxID=2741070 RepID=A0ABZ2L4I8_9BACT